MNSSLKKIIFNKLYEDLSHVEIIPYNDSIWFIDRKNEYWYLEYEKNGYLWWRYDFFVDFFSLFSMSQSEFEPLISKWVEEVLNCDIISPPWHRVGLMKRLDDVLNCEVIVPKRADTQGNFTVDEVLNCKVNASCEIFGTICGELEEVLNCKVNKSRYIVYVASGEMEEVLNDHITKNDIL